MWTKNNRGRGDAQTLECHSPVTLAKPMTDTTQMVKPEVAFSSALPLDWATRVVPI